MTISDERKKAERIVADNRKAHHDYHLIETFEAGVALLGTEVKAIREGRVNLRDSFARVVDGEIFVHNVHIGAYSSRGYADHEALRSRKLLLHRQEIRNHREDDRTRYDHRAGAHISRTGASSWPSAWPRAGARQARDDPAARNRSGNTGGHQVAGR